MSSDKFVWGAQDIKVISPSSDTGSSINQPKTELGRDLWTIRQEGIANGQPLLSEDEMKAASDVLISDEWGAAVDWAKQVVG